MPRQGDHRILVRQRIHRTPRLEYRRKPPTLLPFRYTFILFNASLCSNQRINIRVPGAGITILPLPSGSESITWA